MTDSCLYYFQYTTVSLKLAFSSSLPHGGQNCLLLLRQDKDPIGIIPLEDLCVRPLQDAGKPVPAAERLSDRQLCLQARLNVPLLRVPRQYCLELFNPKGHKIKACKTENKGRVVQGKHQSYKLSAASQVECDSWIDAIRWGCLVAQQTAAAKC